MADNKPAVSNGTGTGGGLAPSPGGSAPAQRRSGGAPSRPSGVGAPTRPTNNSGKLIDLIHSMDANNSTAEGAAAAIRDFIPQLQQMEAGPDLIEAVRQYAESLDRSANQGRMVASYLQSAYDALAPGAKEYSEAPNNLDAYR